MGTAQTYYKHILASSTGEAVSGKKSPSDFVRPIEKRQKSVQRWEEGQKKIRQRSNRQEVPDIDIEKELERDKQWAAEAEAALTTKSHLTLQESLGNNSSKKTSESEEESVENPADSEITLSSNLPDSAVDKIVQFQDSVIDSPPSKERDSRRKRTSDK